MKRALAHAAAGMFFLAFSCFAQITTIEGDVKGTDGKPVVGATVKFVRTDIKQEVKTKTDKKGHYLYMGLALGNYNVVLEIDGKVADQVQGIRTRLGDPTPVNFDLAKSAAQQAQLQQAAQQAAMSGGQLTKEQERQLTPEQAEAIKKSVAEQSEKMKKNKELNDAFNAGMTAMQGTPPNLDEAITQFAKASELDPNQIAVWQQLADAYTKSAKGKTGAEYDAQLGKAIEAYNKALALKPDDAATHNNLALVLGQAKKFPEMQSELEKAATLDPTNAGKYYFNLGAILTNTGQVDMAVEAFKKAAPTNPEAYYQLGVALMAKVSIGADGKMIPAPGTAEAFQQYLQAAPNGPNAATAKEMLETLGSKVDTKYVDPNAKKDTKKKK